MLKSELQGWFESHPAISVRQFGIECGYADGGRFRKWIKIPAKEGERVSNIRMLRIKDTLMEYGYYDDYKIILS